MENTSERERFLRALSILEDQCLLRVRPLSLESFWPAIPKSARGSFGWLTLNQSRMRSLMFRIRSAISPVLLVAVLATEMERPQLAFFCMSLASKSPRLC